MSLQRWDTTTRSFHCHSLSRCGLVVQLGHDGDACPNSRLREGHFTVIHVNGFHFVKVAFCDCGRFGHSETVVQVLRAGWMPATTDRPRTAVTFECLRQFNALNLQGKINAFDYYMAMVQLTDGSGLFVPIVSSFRPRLMAMCVLTRPQNRYKEFFRCVRWYRNLQAWKHGGCVYDPGGVDATEQGALAIECPLCPHPEKNMKPGWESCKEEDGCVVLHPHTSSHSLSNEVSTPKVQTCPSPRD